MRPGSVMVRAVLYASLAAWPAAADTAETLPATFTAAVGDQPAGIVRFDDQARMAVVSAAQGRAAWLDDLARRMNAKTQLFLDAAPPPGAPPRASASIPVTRADPRFFAALKLELSRYYQLNLTRR